MADPSSILGWSTEVSMMISIFMVLMSVGLLLTHFRNKYTEDRLEKLEAIIARLIERED